MYTTVAQPQSAQERFGIAGVGHGDRARVQVTVGVTPAVLPQGRLIAHFCSSRIRLWETLVQGDRSPIPISEKYHVVFQGELRRIDCAAIGRFDALVHPNGSLKIAPTTSMIVVPIPISLLSESPWAYDGGAEEVMAAYRCRNLDEMFRKFGQTVAV